MKNNRKGGEGGGDRQTYCNTKFDNPVTKILYVHASSPNMKHSYYMTGI